MFKIAEKHEEHQMQCQLSAVPQEQHNLGFHKLYEEVHHPAPQKSKKINLTGQVTLAHKSALTIVLT